MDVIFTLLFIIFCGLLLLPCIVNYGKGRLEWEERAKVWRTEHRINKSEDL